MVCPGKVWCGWLGGLWHGRLLYGLFSLGWRGRGRLVLLAFGSVRLAGQARCVSVGPGVVGHGLARLARLVADR